MPQVFSDLKRASFKKASITLGPSVGGLLGLEDYNLEVNLMKMKI